MSTTRPARERGTVRAIAVPSEHGGWGLTAEPGLLGMLVAPSIAGLCLALAAVFAFVARTPAKLVLVDVHRRRNLPRTRVAAAVAGAELLVLAGLVVAADLTADTTDWWLPALVAAPLIAVELWYDMRSRSRRLIPELAGAVGVAGVVTMIVMADDGATSLAVGLWLLLAARAVTSITWVRAQILASHGRAANATPIVWTDVVAVAAAGAAVALRGELLFGAVAVVALVTFQRVEGRREPRPVKVIGMRQMALGFGLVVATAAGVRLI